MSKPIVLWTNIPSFHLIGPFLKLSESRRTICVCREATSILRADMWRTPDLGNLEIFYLSKQNNVDFFVDNFLKETKDAIHFISGFGNQPGTKTFWRLAPKFNIKPIAIAERPNPQKNPVKAFLRDAYYYAKMRMVSRRISAVLCMGSLSVEAYRKYGFPPRKLLHCMYTSAFPFPELPSEVSVGAPLRFVYVGRDDIWIKGLDLLVDALRGFTPDQLTFDFIGPDPDSWINQFACDNNLSGVIRLQGKIPNDKITQKLANDFDVLVLPSRYDGWGMTVSEALFSGIGVLTSDACGSHDVVSASGAGKVIPRGSVDAIKAALLDLVNTPAKVHEWKVCARAYREQLRSEKLAAYLEEVVSYVERDCTGEKPIPYWL